MQTIIGICGGTASGKTTIAEYLKNHFHKQIAVISCDNYYLSRDDLDIQQRREINYDVPEMLDISQIVEDVKNLKAGKIIEQPIFSYRTFLRENNMVRVSPAPIIIVDGMHALYFQELREILDLKVYIDTDPDVRLARRIRRDMRVYNRTLEFVIHQYLDMAKPMHDIYVEPCKKYADMIIPFNDGVQNNLYFLNKIVENMITAGERA